MARILSRYLIRATLLSVLGVTILLLGLYTLIELVREARGLGGGYGVMQLAWYLVQTMPRRLYDVFPFAALIGSLLALALLAAGRELVAMRSVGFDRLMVMICVLAGCLLLTAAVMLVAELLMPEFEVNARIDREHARSGQVHLGRWGDLWLRDGPHMLHVNTVVWHGEEELEFADITVYRLGDEMRPESMILSPRGRHTRTGWELDAARVVGLDVPEMAEQPGRIVLPSSLEREIFAAAVSRPRTLGVFDLSRIIGFLEDNDIDAGPYRMAFWSRLYYPVGIVAMLLVGMPFVVHGVRTVGWGLGVFAGIGLGLVFFILNRMAQGVALVLPVPVWLGALLPALLFGFAGLLLLRRL